MVLAGRFIRPALEAANPDKSENLDQDVGQILMLYFLFAFLGCSAGGFVIDKFKKFKLTACCWYAAAVCAFSTFCYIVQFGNKDLFMFVSCLYGLCQMGLIPVTFNFGGELIYPEAESTSTALLSVAPDIWGIAAIEIVKYILSFNEESSRYYASIFTIVCATLGFITLCFIKEDLGRQRAENEQHSNSNSSLQ